MPYIIVNDKSKPWHYFTGRGFTQVGDVTVDEAAAKRLSLIEASDVMKGRPDLYAAGWKITPVAA